MELQQWYEELECVKKHLVTVDPQLAVVFTAVDNSGFKLHTVIKEPYVALIAAIIGQKIRYQTAKDLRGKLYTQLGTTFTPQQLLQANLSFLNTTASTIIHDVTRYIITHNVDLSTEDGIRSLKWVNGIGPWTVETTLLTCLKNWNLFPLGDKFLQVRMKKLYGAKCDMVAISERWAPYKSVVTWYLWRWF